MLLRFFRLAALTAALMTLLACGGSTAAPSSSPSAAAAASPSADPVAAYKSLARRIDSSLQVHGFVQYCQPIQPNKATQCRDSVVALIAADTDAIALLDGTTPPNQYATQHAALRAALVRDLALAKQALSAIDSGKDTQAALDAFGPNFNKTIVPVLTEIEG